MKTGEISDVGAFLADYTSYIWGCGATGMRTEKNVKRMAEAFGYEAHITVMPDHVSVILDDGDGKTRTYSREVAACGINFDLNTRLSALSWWIRDTAPGLADARRRFGAIIGRRYMDAERILLLASMANASFCRLFGGDAVAMAVVFAATLGGCLVKGCLLKWRFDHRVVFFICALISSAICGGAVMFNWGATPGVALATSVLYLIPGVPYINAASDLIGRRYLCSLYRFADAVVLTACLSAGLCVGLELMKVGTLW